RLSPNSLVNEHFSEPPAGLEPAPSDYESDVRPVELKRHLDARCPIRCGEPFVGIEPTTSYLPSRCAATAPKGPMCRLYPRYPSRCSARLSSTGSWWCPRWDLNPRSYRL